MHFAHLFWVRGVEVFPIVWPSSVFKLVPWNDTLSFCCFCVWFSKKVIPDDNMFYVLPPHHPQLKNVNLKAEATLAKGCLATSKAGRGDAACSSHCSRPARSHTCGGLKELPPWSIDCFIMYRMLCSPPSVWKTIQKLASSWGEVGKGERHGKLKRRPPWWQLIWQLYSLCDLARFPDLATAGE